MPPQGYTEQSSYDADKVSSPYDKLSGFISAYDKIKDQQIGLGANDQASRQGLVKRLNDVGNQFKTLFENNVGRAATDDELNKFFSESAGQSIAQSPYGKSEEDTQNVRNKTAQYIGDTFQKTAQDTALEKTKGLADQYGGLADQYLAMGKNSLSSLADDIRSYSVSLFDKLRPQLNLAAQAGGYGDSGGQTLQEQGALKDLATEGGNYLADKAYGLESNANAIRYGGQAAPLGMEASYVASQPYALSDFANNAGSYNQNVALNRMGFQNQLGLLGAQGAMMQNLQPSFGSTLAQSFANSFGRNAGGNFYSGGKLPPNNQTYSGSNPTSSGPPPSQGGGGWFGTGDGGGMSWNERFS